MSWHLSSEQIIRNSSILPIKIGSRFFPCLLFSLFLLRIPEQGLLKIEIKQKHCFVLLYCSITLQYLLATVRSPGSRFFPCWLFPLFLYEIPEQDCLKIGIKRNCCFVSHCCSIIFIDRVVSRSREIIYLVASVRPSVPPLTAELFDLRPRY